MKILENIGIENTGLEASALNNLITGNKSGIVGKYLNECAFTATGNTIIIDKGLLIICGRQVEIDAIESITFSSLPSEDVRYQVVIELTKEESGEVTASIFARQPEALIQENLMKDGFRYQFELGKVTHKTTGQVTEALRTANILYGQSGAGADIEVGEVNTQMISTELPAEVDINKVLDDGKTKLNFNFSLPKPYEDSVTGLVYSSQIVGESVTINNTNDGYIDEITLEGNTIGGGGTPETPIAIQSVESPVSLVNCGKNLFDKAISPYGNIGSNIITILPTGIKVKATLTSTVGYVGYRYYLRPNTQYTLYSTQTIIQGTNNSRIVARNSSAVYLTFKDTTGSITFTTDSTGTGSILFYSNFNVATGAYEVDYTNIQLEIGSTATTYEPYQGTTLSIPLKDTNGNDITLQRVGTAYDSVYKENGKWYANVKIAKATSNVTNAKPNSAYLGTTGNGTASGTGAITVTGEVIYELATPEIIELHGDTATALESIKTFQGQTNIFGTNTVNPILDVTELAMGIGEKKYALLTDGDGNAVMPVNEADNVIMRDGKTVQEHLDKIANVESGVIYDQVIRTQTDFETLIASPTWLDAESVALVGQFTLSTTDNGGVKIPATVKQIHGFNGAKITITNFKYDTTTNNGGLWYDTIPTTLDYSICDLEVDCTGTAGSVGYGFRNCTNLTNCTGTGSSGSSGFGFHSCTNLTNCTGTGTGKYGYGFNACTNLTNCTGTGTGERGHGFNACTNLTNCTGTATGTVGTATYGYGFRDCTNLTNCTGTATGTTQFSGFGFHSCTNLTNCAGTGAGAGQYSGYGFYNITYASNCKDGGSETAMWGGTNENINVETCRKTLVNADNATLNT